MMFHKQDLRQLRWPLVAASVLMIAGAATLWYAERYLDLARQQQAAALKQRVAAQERVAKASEEEREIRSHLVFYQRMVDAGIVGARNRLDLIEKITAIKSQLKVFDIKYNIEPQKPVDYPGITQTGAMDHQPNQTGHDAAARGRLVQLSQGSPARGAIAGFSQKLQIEPSGPEAGPVEAWCLGCKSSVPLI